MVKKNSVAVTNKQKTYSNFKKKTKKKKMAQQSLLLCLIISIVGGALTIASRVVVILGDKAKERIVVVVGDDDDDDDDDDKIRRKKLRIKIYVTIGFIILSACDQVSCIYAPWFGPVSVYWPTFCAAKLLFNILFIGVIMKHEIFDKSAQVATGVVVCGAILISVNGPGIQNNQNVNDLVFNNIYAIIWLLLLSIVYIICTILMIFTNLHNNFSPIVAENILFIVNICSSPLAGTVSRFSSTFEGKDDDDGPYRAIFMTLTWTIIVIWSIQIYKESAHVRSFARWMPQITFGSIALTGITGVVVWEDYLVVGSWAGYMTAYVLIAMGIYLLCDLDFFLNDEVKILVEDLNLGESLNINNFHDSFVGNLSFCKPISSSSRSNNNSNNKNFKYNNNNNNNNNNDEENGDCNNIVKKQHLLKRNLSSHQLIIINESRRQGLNRGFSNPDFVLNSAFNTTGKTYNDNEDDDDDDDDNTLINESIQNEQQQKEEEEQAEETSLMMIDKEYNNSQTVMSSNASTMEEESV